MADLTPLRRRMIEEVLSPLAPLTLVAARDRLS